MTEPAQTPAAGEPRLPVWRSRRVLAPAAGLLAAVLVITGAALGVLGGFATLVVAAVLALVVPTSRELSRRVLVAGVVFLGWIPMLWWVRIPVTHAAVLLAVVVAVLVWWLLSGPVAVRARALVPRVRWADAALLAAVGLVVWVYLPGLRASSPETVLSRFLRGWDNSAHFDMSAMIVRHGTLIHQVPAGPMGEWAYTDYPQGFHAAAATVMEAVLGDQRDPAVLLTSYGRAMTVVVVLAVAVVIAGLCALPALRRRPLLALPVALFVAATFTLGPGGMLLHDGFPNFVVAVACLACIPLIAAPMPRPTSPVLLAALGAAAMGVAHNWSSLLTMGAGGVLVALSPWRRSRWPRGRRAYLVPGAIAVATLGGLLAAWLQLRGQAPLSEIVVIPGGVNPVPFAWLFTTVAAAVVACAVLCGQTRSTKTGARSVAAVSATRTAWAGLMPLVGGLVLLVIAYLQVRGTGDVGYYFWKYAIALELLAAVVLGAALPWLLAPRAFRTWSLRTVGVLASLGLALAAVQVYGLPRSLPTSLGTGLAPGAVSRTDYVALAAAPGADARMVLRAVAADSGAPDVPHILVPPTIEHAAPPMMLQQWYNALTGRWTLETQDLLVDLPAPNGTDIDSAVANALHILDRDEDAVVVVSPEYVDDVRAAAQTRGWGDRVTTW